MSIHDKIVISLKKFYPVEFFPVNIEFDTISLGAANDVVKRCLVVGANSKSLSLIYKVSWSKGELIFHEKLEDSCVFLGKRWVPKYLLVDKISKDRYEVIQIDVGTNHKTLLSKSEAQYLGGCLGVLSNLPITDGGEWGRSRIQIKLEDLEFFKSEILQNNIFEISDIEKKNLLALINYFTQLDYIFAKKSLGWAHNDIKYEHLYEQSGGLLYVIDWGMLSPNIFAADLHHFFIQSMLGRPNDSFEIIAEAYCQTIASYSNMPYDFDDCLFGAAYFSLRQNLRWFREFPKNNFFISAINFSIEKLLYCISK